MAKQQGLFKWIGGKRWLAPELAKLVAASPVSSTGYAEPFAGGMGALPVVLEELKKKGITALFLNDINSSLINAYQQLQRNPAVVARQLLEEENIFTQKKAIAYLESRLEFNKIKGENSLREAVLFLFLMTHCFNGVYRENSKGGFNVPFNKSETAMDKSEAIQTWYSRFGTASFSSLSYEVFLRGLPSSTLVYADPPYYIPGQKVTNRYHKQAFSYEDQLTLATELDRFDTVIVSGHYSGELEALYSQKGYTVTKRHRTNIISANTASRGKQMEELLAYKGISYVP